MGLCLFPVIFAATSILFWSSPSAQPVSKNRFQRTPTFYSYFFNLKPQPEVNPITVRRRLYGSHREPIRLGKKTVDQLETKRSPYPFIWNQFFKHTARRKIAVPGVLKPLRFGRKRSLQTPTRSDIGFADELKPTRFGRKRDPFYSMTKLGFDHDSVLRPRFGRNGVVLSLHDSETWKPFRYHSSHIPWLRFRGKRSTNSLNPLKPLRFGKRSVHAPSGFDLGFIDKLEHSRFGQSYPAGIKLAGFDNGADLNKPRSRRSGRESWMNSSEIWSPVNFDNSRLPWLRFHQKRLTNKPNPLKPLRFGRKRSKNSLNPLKPLRFGRKRSMNDLNPLKPFRKQSTNGPNPLKPLRFGRKRSMKNPGALKPLRFGRSSNMKKSLEDSKPVQYGGKSSVQNLEQVDPLKYAMENVKIPAEVYFLKYKRGPTPLKPLRFGKKQDQGIKEDLRIGRSAEIIQKDSSIFKPRFGRNQDLQSPEAFQAMRFMQKPADLRGYPKRSMQSAPLKPLRFGRKRNQDPKILKPEWGELQDTNVMQHLRFGRKRADEVFKPLSIGKQKRGMFFLPYRLRKEE